MAAVVFPLPPFGLANVITNIDILPKLTSRILRSFGEFGVNAIIKVVVDTANNVDVIINVNINTIVIISNAAIVNINDIFAVNDNDNNPVLVINLHV